jgi:hypothetical protein
MSEQMGRNEPCHCGSGKKFKRCHGVDAPPLYTPPRSLPTDPSASLDPNVASQMTGAGGFDPNSIDPEWLNQFTSSMKKLPKGQLLKMASLMQKAMAGKDVTKEAAELEKHLPPDIQTLVKSAAFMKNAGQAGAAAPVIDTSSEKIEERKEGLTKFNKFWGKITGK